MGIILSLFSKKEERRSVSFPDRLVNILRNNFRGIVPFFVIIISLASMFDANKKNDIVAAVWIIVGCLFLFAPMPIGAICLVPVFAMPMFGVVSSAECCGCLINENILLFFVGGWLLLLMNNCGLDKRMACFFLACGDKTTYTPFKLLLKTCMASFCTSALGDRELSTVTVMNYVNAGLQPTLNVKGEANYGEFKKILINAVAISSSIGSFCILNASLTTLQMKSLFCDFSMPILEYPDIFNFLNYSAYAVPVALLMLIANTAYESFLVSRYIGKKPMSVYSQEVVQKAFKKQQQDLGPMSNHEKVSAFFMIVILLCYFTRWSKWLGMGWATFRQFPAEPNLCGIKDCTTASIFVVLLHFLPKSLNFLKIFSAKKRRDIPVMKAESGILFWKFVDKNTDYSLFFVLGAGTIINKAMIATNLHLDIKSFCGEAITNLDWNVGVLIVVLLSIVGASIAPGLGSQACIMPFIMGIALSDPKTWVPRGYLLALAVGLGSGLGFCSPFIHTPSYFVKSVGNVEPKKQVMYSLISVLLCGIILWLSLCFYAPILWDPDDAGILAVVRPGLSMPNVTEAPEPPPALR